MLAESKKEYLTLVHVVLGLNSCFFRLVLILLGLGLLALGNVLEQLIPAGRKV
jgi:hypothetical protein